MSNILVGRGPEKVISIRMNYFLNIFEVKCGGQAWLYLIVK
jgi:hypothetical protein